MYLVVRTYSMRRLALDLTTYLVVEEDGIPWTAALNGLSYLVRMLQRTPDMGALQAYLLPLLQPSFDRLGFSELPADSFLDRRLRVKVKFTSWFRILCFMCTVFLR